MQCLRRCALAFLAVIALLAGAGAAVAWTASGWLARSDPPGKADAIVVLGHEPIRVYEAADLFKQGVAPLVVLSRPKRQHQRLFLEARGFTINWFEVAGAKILADAGVPAEAVRVIDEEVISTVTEAIAFGRALPQAARIVVVTSPSHVFRSRLIFRRTLADRQIAVVGNRHETLDRAWWRDQEDALAVIAEFIKLPFYLAGGRMRPAQP